MDQPLIRPLLAIASLSITGCSLLQVDVDIKEVCVHRRDIVIEARTGVPQVAFRVELDELGEVTNLLESSDELHFVRFQARPTSGVRSLAFVDTVQVYLAAMVVEPSLPPLLVFACDGDCSGTGGTLALRARSDDNAVDYLRELPSVFEVQLGGQLPSQPCTLDVDVCLSGKLTRTLAW